MTYTPGIPIYFKLNLKILSLGNQFVPITSPHTPKMSGQDDTKSLKEKVLSILPSHDSSRAKEFDNNSVRTFE